MRLLCDTQVILWWMLNDARLTAGTRALLADRGNEILFSSVSLWEVALKVRIGKFSVSVEAVDAGCRRAGMTLLKIEVAHLAAVSRMVDVPHNDPFDHLLIAQAVAEGVPFLTADRVVQRYPVEIIKA